MTLGWEGGGILAYFPTVNFFDNYVMWNVKENCAVGVTT